MADTKEKNVFFDMPNEEDIEFLLFENGKKHWAVWVKNIVRFFALEGIAPVPLAPPSFLGLTNLAGTVYPVIDLGGFFDKESPRKSAEDKKSILLKQNARELIVQTDRIVGLELVEKTVLETEETILSRTAFSFKENRYLVLDIEKMFRQVMLEQKAVMSKVGFIVETSY